MSISDVMSNPNSIPFSEIPGPDDWFVWESDSEGSETTAVRICFRSWLAPGRWLAELVSLCGVAAAARA